MNDQENPSGELKEQQKPEREFEIGMDEYWKTAMGGLHREYQQESLTAIRNNRAHFDKLISDAQTISNQVAQNAVSHAHAIMAAELANSQLVAASSSVHSQLAVDRQWNVDEVAHLVANTPVFMDAVAAAVAQAAQAINVTK